MLSSVIAEPGGIYRVEFTPAEVGSHLVEVTVAGEKLPAGPLLAKVYNAALIRVTDVASGVVGQPCQFRGKYFCHTYAFTTNFINILFVFYNKANLNSLLKWIFKHFPIKLINQLICLHWTHCPGLRITVTLCLVEKTLPTVT